jgi:DNA-binding NarL/FixJ family response regulator
MTEANGRITVLIAEDEPSVRAALSDLIEIEDELQLVGAAADAQEAIDLAREHRPDVALVDVKMPAGGGTRAAREIRALSPATRVVALSAYEDRTTVLDMLRVPRQGNVGR